MKGLFLFVLLLVSLNAQSALIDRNYNSNQNWITYDTVNDVEWLKLDATIGSTPFSSNQSFGSDGWRFATVSDMNSLFNSYGLSSLSTTVSILASNDPRRFAHVNILQSLGLSSTSGNCLTGYLLDSNSLFSYMDSCIGINDTSTVLSSNQFSIHSISPNPNFGTFMVRTTSVSEPSTFLFAIISLISLSILRNRRS